MDRTHLHASTGWLARRAFYFLPILFASRAWAARIRLSQLDPLPSTVTPRAIWEEPTAQTGDTFRVLNHRAGWYLLVVRSGMVLRLQVAYTVTVNTDGSHTVKLATPLAAGEWIGWQKLV